MSEKRIMPKCRRNEIVVQDFENEVLIYDLSSNKAFSLNKSSAAIWKRCDGEHSIAEVAEELSIEFDASVSDDFVRLALEQFRKDSLLDEDEATEGFFEGLSRRQVIRNVGLASIISLPLVSSLVAPAAISAQSSACAGACQCPNPTANYCSPAGGGGTLNCNPLSGTCRCTGGPLGFGTPGSGSSPGQKTGSCGEI
ncbi:MAG: PqqD family protein [Pyrinomonadaceae bacterium]